jgi:phosphoribosyl 1,2-cyclic phosphodiesterase
MDIKIIASGSTGNCYVISDDVTTIMIECGISIREIQRRIDFGISSIDGCLISHSHKDHCKAFNDLLRYSVDCYASKETWEQLGGIEHHRQHGIKPMKKFEIGTMLVIPFDLQHDIEGCLGFILISKETGEKAAYITDSFYSKYKIPGLNYLLIECNNDPEILNQNIENGTIPASLGNRLMQSHFSIDDVLDFLEANDLSKMEAIYLIHISEGNGDPQDFKRRVMAQTGIPTYIAKEMI